MLSSSHSPYQAIQHTCRREKDASSSYHHGSATLDLEQSNTYDTDSTLEKIQWRSLQDELRNLLLFAGLLSAIITPFIIESNKKLGTPDSAEDAVVTLFTHMATSMAGRTDSVETNTSNPVGVPIPDLTFVPSDSTFKFVPNSSYMRANTFWSISLVLSLTTVLIGTLLSQWLRACGPYPSSSSHSSGGHTSPIFSPFLNGNSNSTHSNQSHPKFQNDRPRLLRPECQVRHIRILLATLPLFLQLAVVLFIGGLMDYVQIFGDCGVWVSVGGVFVFVGFIFKTVTIY